MATEARKNLLLSGRKLEQNHDYFEQLSAAPVFGFKDGIQGVRVRVNQELFHDSIYFEKTTVRYH